jgi:hypothetical protein
MHQIMPTVFATKIISDQLQKKSTKDLLFGHYSAIVRFQILPLCRLQTIRKDEKETKKIMGHLSYSVLDHHVLFFYT